MNQPAIWVAPPMGAPRRPAGPARPAALRCEDEPAGNRGGPADGRDGAQPAGVGQYEQVEASREDYGTGQQPGRRSERAAPEDRDEQQAQAVIHLIAHTGFEGAEPCFRYDAITDGSPGRSV